MTVYLSAIEDVEERRAQDEARKAKELAHAKKCEAALDKIHLLLTNLDGRDYTPLERKIFDIAEDALLDLE